jgi:hypothetical protein
VVASTLLQISPYFEGFGEFDDMQEWGTVLDIMCSMEDGTPVNQVRTLFVVPQSLTDDTHIVRG